jgi:hypothetical protein
MCRRTSHPASERHPRRRAKLSASTAAGRTIRSSKTRATAWHSWRRPARTNQARTSRHRGRSRSRPTLRPLGPPDLRVPSLAVALADHAAAPEAGEVADLGGESRRREGCRYHEARAVWRELPGDVIDEVLAGVAGSSVRKPALRVRLEDASRALDDCRCLDESWQSKAVRSDPTHTSSCRISLPRRSLGSRAGRVARSCKQLHADV